MRTYVSGGMTGWPDNNEEAFDDAAAWLRGLGHTVYTPVEFGRVDGENLKGDGFQASDEEYEGFLDRDLDFINANNIESVVFVRGWSFSGGAGREGRKAIEQGLKLYLLVERVHHGKDLIQVTPEWFESNTRTARLTREEVTA